MNIIETAREAFALFQNGRAALAKIAKSVKDGSAALSSDDQAELNRMLEAEKAESRAAHDDLEQAIVDAGG